MFQELYTRKIVTAVGVMAVIALGAYTYGTIKQTEYMYHGPTVISVAGKGEVFAAPDIATFSFTVDAKEADAVTAQDKAAATMNAILTYLKGAGVEEKDIKTQYFNLSPQYEQMQPCGWGMPCPPQAEPKIIGYEVNQSVSVKVRDTKKAGELVSQVGGMGAQNVSGLSFTIDDEDKLKAEAREKAIVDAQEKAQILAKNLGVRIVRMNGFWEDEGGPIMYSGMGGGYAGMNKAMDMAVPQAASLPQGENTVASHVNISYEIR